MHMLRPFPKIQRAGYHHIEKLPTTIELRQLKSFAHPQSIEDFKAHSDVTVIRRLGLFKMSILRPHSG